MIIIIIIILNLYTGLTFQYKLLIYKYVSCAPLWIYDIIMKNAYVSEFFLS